MGCTTANKLAQRAVRSTIGLNLIDDGIMGIKTSSGINMCKPAPLMAAIKASADGFYRSLVLKNPKLGKFLNGWLKRANDSPIREK